MTTSDIAAFAALVASCGGVLSLLGYIIREGERRGAIASENKARDEKISALQAGHAQLTVSIGESTKALSETITKHHEEEMAAINALGNQMAEMRGRRASDR